MKHETCTCVLDTETTRDASNKCLVYDLGYVIVGNVSGNVYTKRSVLISEIFYDYSVMQGAYYADKIPNYLLGLSLGDCVTMPLKDAWNVFLDDCNAYHVTVCAAYNVRFDYNALNHTISKVSNGFQETWFPETMKLSDIWVYAGETVCNSDSYVSWCLKHSFVTKRGNPCTSAETVYRYITDDTEFVESHTALNDAMIEWVILRSSKAYHRKHSPTWGRGYVHAATRAARIRETA